MSLRAAFALFVCSPCCWRSGHVTGLIAYRSLESYDLVRSLEDAYCSVQNDIQVSNEFELRRCKSGKSASVCEWAQGNSCGCGNEACQVCCKVDTPNGKVCRNASEVVAPGVADRKAYDGVACAEKPTEAWQLCRTEENGKLCAVERKNQFEVPKICFDGACRDPDCTLLGPNFQACQCDSKFFSPLCCRQSSQSDDTCESFAAKLKRDKSGYLKSIKFHRKRDASPIPPACPEGYRIGERGGCVTATTITTYCSVATNDGKLCHPRSTCRDGKCEHVCGSPYQQCACTPANYCKTCCKFNGTCTFVNLTSVVVDPGHEPYAEEAFCSTTFLTDCTPGTTCREGASAAAFQSTVKVAMIYVLGGAVLVIFVLAAFCLSSSKHHKNPPRASSPSVLPIGDDASDMVFNV